jgi:hypothetical protein
MSKKKGSTPIDIKEYYRLFGMEPGNPDVSKSKEALKRAWETRNFEIDKFWVRVAYFWGFIAVIFGAYIAVITEEKGKAIDLNLDLYLVLLGGIFSVAWLLVICGSKSWQQNWEEHINKLENGITGPLYKTIYCTKKPYYSVSGINKILAWAVIGVWVILFLECIVRKKVFKGILKIFGNITVNDFMNDLFVLLSIVAAVICIILLLIKGQSNNGNSRIQKENHEDERGFINTGKRIY